MTVKLEEALLQYAETDAYGFHMPGHKRQTGERSNPFLSGNFPLASIDVTEIPPFDDLHDPHGILKEEMEYASRFYGTRRTIFSVNGSTASNLAAVSASVRKGGTIAAPSNCHRSIFHAAKLRDLRVVNLPVGELIPDVPGPVTAETLNEALEKEPCEAVVITSPSYEGVVSDIASLAETAHAHGAILIADEAHGAHFSRHPFFPRSAIVQGADLVIQSLHKTLPSLTQTSLLHSVTGKVGENELMKWMDVYETSSPSYILMASITSCIRLLSEHGEAYFEPYVRSLSALRESLKGLRRLKLFDAPFEDPSKILISTAGTGISGEDLAEMLRTEDHLETEKSAPHYVLCMTSPADSEEGFRRLQDALIKIDEKLAFQGQDA